MPSFILLILSGSSTCGYVFGVFSLSTAHIDKFFTDSTPVDNYYPPGWGIVDKFKNPLRGLHLFDMIMLFLLLILFVASSFIHKLWITCG